MKVIGILAICAGVILALFAYNLDTSVDTGFGRVNNIGLMESRTNFLHTGLAAIVAGILLVGFAGAGGGNKKKGYDIEDKKDTEKSVSYSGERDIHDGKYQLFLTRKYGIEKNSALEKYVVGDDLFATLEDALAYADKQLLAEDESNKLLVAREESEADARVRKARAKYGLEM